MKNIFNILFAVFIFISLIISAYEQSVGNTQNAIYYILTAIFYLLSMIYFDKTKQ